jgi:hypothetical protein
MLFASELAQPFLGQPRQSRGHVGKYSQIVPVPSQKSRRGFARLCTWVEVSCRTACLSLELQKSLPGLFQPVL